MVTQRDIRMAIRDVAGSFGGKAEETIRYENEGKHVTEVQDILKSGDQSTVVDLGGGLGINFLVLRLLGHSGRLILVERFDEYDQDNRMGSRDRAFPMLERAGVEVMQLDFWPECNLTIETGAVDVACCHDVLEHLPGHPFRQLAELHRVLRSGGRVLISAPNAASLMKRVKLLGGRQPYSSYEDWIQDRYYEHYREYLKHEYEDLLRRAGFEEVRGRYSAAVTFSRGRNRYFRRRRSAVSPTAVALQLISAIEWIAPPLRHTVYAEGIRP